MRLKPLLILASLVLLAFIGDQLYPYALFHIMSWQKLFNRELAESLNLLKTSPWAGGTLVAVSFIYGVFHAIGPGHGKFILSSYLALEPTALKQAVKISLISALLQGVVAVLLVSVIVVGFTLSRTYLNLTILWIERASFGLMALFGLFWLVQGIKGIRASSPKSPKIHQLRPQKIGTFSPPQARLSPQIHQHSPTCGCGHQHLPSASQLKNQNPWLVIFSIGIRPCSGAILVLFLAYTLDFYGWGVLSAMAMAVGTGLTLSLFALLVALARHQAVKIRGFYANADRIAWSLWLKIALGILLIGFACLWLQATFLSEAPANPFKR